jgi:hypothetical protein
MSDTELQIVILNHINKYTFIWILCRLVASMLSEIFFQRSPDSFGLDYCNMTHNIFQIYLLRKLMIIKIKVAVIVSC